MDQSLASRAVEERGRGLADVVVGLSRFRLLQRGPKLRTLSTIADGSGARLTKVLLGGIDIGHELSPEFLTESERGKLRIQHDGCQGRTLTSLMSEATFFATWIP